MDALAVWTDEGRRRQRNRRGGDKQPLIRRCPNGVTHSFEYFAHSARREPSELKHLSKVRKRKQLASLRCESKRVVIPPVAVSEKGRA